MRFELHWLVKTNFFPTREDFSPSLKEICIATKSSQIGDALILTTLPGLLAQKHPHLKIRTYPRAFNPVVFKNNPHVQGVNYLPSAVFGDDINQGTGHLIHTKERFFDLPLSQPPKPILYLSEKEKTWAKKYLQKVSLPQDSRPIILIHPWGKTRNNVLSQAQWEDLVQKQNAHFRFFQLGLFGQPQIRGCEQYCFFPKGYSHARQLFSLVSVAQGFIGVDSGPMHVAQAFNLPSLVFINHQEASPNETFLYERNTHLQIGNANIPTEVSHFFESIKASAVNNP